MLGEQIDFTRENGARHLACAELPAGPRRNTYGTRCARCGAYVKAHAGVLEVEETKQADGTYARRSAVRCEDVAPCRERQAAGLTASIAPWQRVRGPRY